MCPTRSTHSTVPSARPTNTASGLSKRYTPPQLFPFVWACGSVDVERMDEGSRYLLGKRDFASLKNAGRISAQRVRTILSITRTPRARSPKAASN